MFVQVLFWLVPLLFLSRRDQCFRIIVPLLSRFGTPEGSRNHPAPTPTTPGNDPSRKRSRGTAVKHR